MMMVTFSSRISPAAGQGTDSRLEVQLPECLQARANPDQLSQVLANLLQNASRYTPSGGGVDGILASDLPHVFERF